MIKSVSIKSIVMAAVVGGALALGACEEESPMDEAMDDMQDAAEEMQDAADDMAN